MSNSRIQLYTWGTPNGRKISIALEEMGLEYEVHPVNLMKNEQFDPNFIAISPNTVSYTHLTLPTICSV